MPAEGRGPGSRVTYEVAKDRGLAMSLEPPTSVQKLQSALQTKAKGSPGYRFYLLYDKVYRKDVLEYAYRRCKANQGAPGADGQDFTDIEAYGVERWLGELADILRRKEYRASPVRRVWIPKPGGKQRPLGIPRIWDRVVMAAAGVVLEPIFAADLPDEQHGYRANCSAHTAVQAINRLLNTGHIRMIEADLADFFTHVCHSWLQRMVRERIADPVILSLIGKWLNAGAMQNGVVIRSEEGTPQGGPISCVLANIYLHFTLDLWFERKFKPQCRGEAHLVRFVDDFVVSFQYLTDAEDFQRRLRGRFAQFNLELAEEKTRLLLFGRFAAERRAQYGQRPETFEFLAFKHVCGTDRRGRFTVIRIPSVRSCRKFLARVREWLLQHMHWSWREQQSHLPSTLHWFYQYFGLYHCQKKLGWIYCEVQRHWRRALCRQGQRHRLHWSYLATHDWFKLRPPPTRAVHPTV